MSQTTTDAELGHATQGGPEELAAAFSAVRQASMQIRQPLSDEDCQIQSMPEASPIKWHLAHTTWFFEQFILRRFIPDYTPHHPQFGFLFNSYYNAVGAMHQRPRRGLVTRPAMREVEQYRASVDEQVLALLTSDMPPQLGMLMHLGINHEQQHQELMVTDIKHALWCNPLRPAYHDAVDPQRAAPSRSKRTWLGFEEGMRWIGHDGGGFAYDNEQPRHRTFLEAFELCTHPVTNGEFLEFIEAGGYREPRWWLDQGWTTVQQENWQAPLYWEQCDGEWRHFTLSGMQEIDRDQPVCHISYFEADAFARWAGARLPREQEWEIATDGVPIAGNLAESRLFHPCAERRGTLRHAAQLYGDVWEWTASPYVGYPGYRAAEGALGEYNGKFMCNQWVLRGGSCATPQSHVRPTYRNFFAAAARWQFSGVRLARDAQ